MLEGKGLIYIKKRALPQWLTMFIIIMPFFLQALLQLFKIPGLIKYTIDAAWILILFAFLAHKTMGIKRQIVPFAVFAAVFFCYCVTAHMFNFESPFYLLWGFRNNFRFYVAFFAFALFLEYDDIKTIFKLIDVLFVVNLFVSLYQMFVLGQVGDFCGGIFGTQTGSNASTLLFFSVVSSRSMLLYMSGRENAVLCIGKCSICLLLAAIAELKSFFVFFVLIVIMATFMTRSSWKKTVFIIAVAVVIIMSNTILTVMFDSSISIENIIKQLTYKNYSSTEDLGRFTAIPQISQTILTDWKSKLFGMGLGNCDTSSFAICNTPFFQSHQSLNYIWFSSACLFLEVGAIGLVIFLLFFIMCFVFAYKQLKNGVCEPINAQMAMIMAAICVVLTFYNASLRSEIGYIAYFILALPFVSMPGKAPNLVYSRFGE